MFKQQQQQQWQGKIFNQNYLIRGVRVKSRTFFFFYFYRITGLFFIGGFAQEFLIGTSASRNHAEAFHGNNFALQSNQVKRSRR